MPFMNNGMKLVTKYTNVFISVKKRLGIVLKKSAKKLTSTITGSNNISNTGLKTIIAN